MKLRNFPSKEDFQVIFSEGRAERAQHPDNETPTDHLDWCDYCRALHEMNKDQEHPLVDLLMGLNPAPAILSVLSIDQELYQQGLFIFVVAYKLGKLVATRELTEKLESRS